MFLLNRLAISAAPKAVIKFTSHYVPIKSTFLFIVLFLPIYLHPIMFLLNRHVNYNILVQLLYLHPIMFLLNRHILHHRSQRVTTFTSHYVPIKSHTNIILYFLPFSTHFLSTTAKTSQADVRNLLNYLLTTLLKPHESMDCQLPHKNALS